MSAELALKAGRKACTLNIQLFVLISFPPTLKDLNTKLGVSHSCLSNDFKTQALMLKSCLRFQNPNHKNKISDFNPLSKKNSIIHFTLVNRETHLFFKNSTF